jgi:DNA-binding GntR family transcriptional regulator
MTDQERHRLSALWARRDSAASASDAVHRVLREAILQGALEPGRRLGEEDLAELLGVSRTPIREAILRLEAERLAARAARRGLVVATVGRQEILELYAVRVAIDGLSARLAAEAAGPANVATLNYINEQLHEASLSEDWTQMAQLNLEFHSELAQAGRNSVLIDLVQTVHDRVRRFPGTTFSVDNRASEAVDEHRLIISSVAAHDGARAETAARKHMERAMEVRISMIARERPT